MRQEQPHSRGALTGTSATFSGEITANGGIALGDSDKATFGASDDLQIWHDGSNSYIKDAGAGDLIIYANAFRLGDTNGESWMRAYLNGRVDLYYDNAIKLTTTSTGVDVTGNIDTDTLNIMTGGHIKFDFNGVNTPFTSQNSPYIFAGQGASGNYLAGTLNLQSRSSYDRNINFITGATPAIRMAVTVTGVTVTGTFKATTILDTNDSAGTSNQVLTSTGSALDWKTLSEISGVDGSGTANYLSKWTDGDTIGDSIIYESSSKIGIGTDAPLGKLHIVNGSGITLPTLESSARNMLILEGDQSENYLTIATPNTSYAGINFADEQHKAEGWIQYKHGDDYMRFATNNSEAMRITSDGKVGIGTNAPAKPLHVRVSPGWATLRLEGAADSGGEIEFYKSSTKSGSIHFDASGNYEIRPLGVAGKFNILANGNVGIGQTSPNYPLHIGDSSGAGTVMIEAGDSVNCELKFREGNVDGWRMTE